jgi:hypothetical protein
MIDKRADCRTVSSSDESLPAFMIGHPCLAIARDNWLNANLFLGRTVHFTLQLIEPLCLDVEILDALDVGIRSVVASCSIPGDGATQADVAAHASLVQHWYCVEMSTLGRTPDADWVDAAEDALAYFIEVGREATPVRTAPVVAQMAEDDPLAFLQWVDESGSGGPSAELMCYMNPYWRRAGFIYGSPFDGIMTLNPDLIVEPYSRVASLRKRGLHPPNCL